MVQRRIRGNSLYGICKRSKIWRKDGWCTILEKRWWLGVHGGWEILYRTEGATGKCCCRSTKMLQKYQDVLRVSLGKPKSSSTSYILLIADLWSNILIGYPILNGRESSKNWGDVSRRSNRTHETTSYWLQWSNFKCIYLAGLGQLFIIQTDHQTLQRVNNVKDENSRLARWSLSSSATLPVWTQKRKSKYKCRLSLPEHLLKQSAAQRKRGRNITEWSESIRSCSWPWSNLEHAQ